MSLYFPHAEIARELTYESCAFVHMDFSKNQLQQEDFARSKAISSLRIEIRSFAYEEEKEQGMQGRSGQGRTVCSS